MSQGQLGVLHTNSAYAPSMPSLPSVTEDIKLKRILSQIQILESKENAFAMRFGYPNLESFIAGVRKILSAAPNDIRVLQQFSSGNLQRHFEQFRRLNSNMFLKQKIILNLKGDSKKLNELMDAHGGNEGITWSIEAPNTVILAEWNTAIIKNITNKLTGTHFQTESDNTDSLLAFLRSNISKAIEVKIGDKEESIDQFIVNNTISPFGLKQKDIKALAKNNPELLATIRTRINTFIENDLCAGASSEMQNAIKSVMKAKFNNFQNLETLSFFMGGKGWSTHAIGAFGELQAAIMFQYIANKTPNRILAAEIAKIIGDELNGYSQQFHTDIEILKAFGLQVKNYDGTINPRTKEEKTVEVRLHPTEVASLGGSEGVVDYIVNSYFNTSIPQYSEAALNDFFKGHASELLNLDFNINIPDQVSFYMIGSNLIPGSAILREAFINLTLKVSTTISGSTGGSDSSYLSNAQGWHNSFAKWWRSTTQPPTKGNFEPTGNNNIGAWDRYVSIATKFTYSAIFDGAYKLF